MVPPDSFSTAAPQSSSAFCNGCDAGTQCDSFSSKVFSCASAGVEAGVTVAASSNANNPVFIDIAVSPPLTAGLQRPFADIVIYYNCHCKRAAIDATAVFEPAMLRGQVVVRTKVAIIGAGPAGVRLG